MRARAESTDERGVDTDDDCAAHSYGQVHGFFVQPCTALYRGLFEVRDGRARAVIAVG